ncbi:MAG TPA: glycosyl hydrolase family 18 protein [Caulobacteraceae bacterium]|nr:glycosyl hydrolase family 18 protein [Caulobacteraceae bacterium]
MRSILAGAAAALAMGGAALAASPANVLFYVPWDQAGRAEAPARLAGGVTFAPLWVTLTSADGTLAVADDAKSFPKVRRPGPVMPLVSNAHDGVWDGPAVVAATTDSAVRDRVIGRLVTLAQQRGWAGYVFDFEALPPPAAAAYPAFVAAAKAALAAHGKRVWSAALLSADPLLLKGLQDASDRLVVMAYDQCWATSTPGPVAGEDWLEFTLAQKLPGLDAKKLVLGLATYAYDWPAGGTAAILSVPDARALAARHGAAVTRDLATANATFGYVAADGVPHSVWIADETAFSWAAGAARKAGVRDVALWRLGLEAPTFWTTRPAGGDYVAAGAAPPKLPRCVLLPQFAPPPPKP